MSSKSVLKVARLGHPVLRKKAKALTSAQIKSPEIERLIDNMIVTMREYSGVGLAAPQVHESVRLAVIEISSENPRYPGQSSQVLEVFINPKIRVLDKKTQGHWEGCLSVPGMRGLVHRPRKIQVDYLDRTGAKRKIVAKGFMATVLQHELDHLDGVLYVDRLTDPRKFAFTEEYGKYWTGPGEAQAAD